MNETTHNGWSDWESQLNRKTERRRKADALWLRKFRKAALIIFALSAFPGFSAIVLFACGVLSATLAAVLIATSISLMSFNAGYTCGIIKHK